MGKPTLKQFAAHSKQTLDDAAARLAKLEAASVQSDTKPTAAQKAGADLARAKMAVGLAQAGVVDPEAEAGKASAKARRSGGLLVPVKPTQTELDLPVNEAGAGLRRPDAGKGANNSQSCSLPGLPVRPDNNLLRGRALA